MHQGVGPLLSTPSLLCHDQYGREAAINGVESPSRPRGAAEIENEMTPKLLPIAVRNPIRIEGRTPMSKSFLVLFFKKELLLTSYF
jgi:hypothetical protein